MFFSVGLPTKETTSTTQLASAKPKNTRRRRVISNGKLARKESSAHVEDIWICNVCKALYGSDLDAKSTDAWYCCRGCNKVFHESCAWDVGIIGDDDKLVCMNCFDKVKE